MLHIPNRVCPREPILTTNIPVQCQAEEPHVIVSCQTFGLSSGAEIQSATQQAMPQGAGMHQPRGRGAHV